MNYQYRIFNYSVRSDFELTCYPDDSCDVDVHIQRGKIPAVMDSVSIDSGGFWIKAQQCLISIPGVARYYISDGNRIVIEPDGNGQESEVAIYLLGSAFGFLMMQRGEFPLHGSAIAYNGWGVLILGHSGSGKTSLAAGFVNHGGKVVSDDVSRLTEFEGRYGVFPSYPLQKIWASAAEALRVRLDPQKPIINRVDKFYVDERSRFSDCPVHVDVIIELVPGPSHSVELFELDQTNRLNALITHTYRYECMGVGDYLKGHFDFISRLSNAVPVYRLYRPDCQFTVDEQIQAIIEILMREGA